MMTIEQAIESCKRDAEANRRGALEYARVHDYGTAKDFQLCAQRQEQIAEWLTELKQRKDNHSHWIDRDGVYVCANCGGENGVMTTFCPDCGYEMDGDMP